MTDTSAYREAMDDAQAVCDALHPTDYGGYSRLHDALATIDQYVESLVARLDKADTILSLLENIVPQDYEKAVETAEALTDTPDASFTESHAWKMATDPKYRTAQRIINDPGVQEAVKGLTDTPDTADRGDMTTGRGTRTNDPQSCERIATPTSPDHAPTGEAK